jgi:hypothetical protein
MSPYSTEVLKTTRLLETLNPYYIYSGYYYTRLEIEENAPDVAKLMTDAFVEAVLWAKANPQKALDSLMAQPAYGRLSKELHPADVRALSLLAEAYRLLPVRRSERAMAEGRIANQRVGILDGGLEDQGDERRLGACTQDELHGYDVREAWLEGAGASANPAERTLAAWGTCRTSRMQRKSSRAGAISRAGRADEAVDVHGQDVQRVTRSMRTYRRAEAILSGSR